MNGLKKQLSRARRAHRTRVSMHGTELKPRLSVSRSLKHIYVQLINDDKGVTMASCSDKEVKTDASPIEIAKEVGEMIAKKAIAAGVEAVVFDRGSFRYHGRVASLADGARSAGLKF
ncbi:MAG: 50S ribosomal protein L18 [Candidatus Uhrbacteria bacterium]|nr:50S ribosomal protein L18 [Candidatus Uhrbacteria bacterium]